MRRTLPFPPLESSRAAAISVASRARRQRIAGPRLPKKLQKIKRNKKGRLKGERKLGSASTATK
jgi:hypothetical protein